MHERPIPVETLTITTSLIITILPLQDPKACLFPGVRQDRSMHTIAGHSLCSSGSSFTVRLSSKTSLRHSSHYILGCCCNMLLVRWYLQNHMQHTCDPIQGTDLTQKATKNKKGEKFGSAPQCSSPYPFHQDSKQCGHIPRGRIQSKWHCCCQAFVQ